MFYTFTYNGKLFGVLEFPVTSYPLPIAPILKLKGLEVGRIYYRQGTTNTEALGHEIVAIVNWLHSLPEHNEQGSSQFSSVNDLIKRLTHGEEKLSTLIAEILIVAKKFRLEELINFCTNEIQGLEKSSELKIEAFRHRVQKVKSSWLVLELNAYSFLPFNEHAIINELDKNKDFFDFSVVLGHPLIEIEDALNKYLSSPKGGMGTLEFTAKECFPDWKGRPDIKIYSYLFKSNYENLYRNIRQKAIDNLMKVNSYEG